MGPDESGVNSDLVWDQKFLGAAPCQVDFGKTDKSQDGEGQLLEQSPEEAALAFSR